MSRYAIAQTQQTPIQDKQAGNPPTPGALPPKSGADSSTTTEGEDKRILGVLPNYRTAEMSAATHPLTPKQKMRIAVQDSFDYPLAIVALGYSGLYQLEDSHPQFGQGFAGYMKRFGTAYTDQIDGNMMTEGILPVLLHEDPRYFRMSNGTIKKRVWYALSRIVVTRTDSGKETFNFSEIVGTGISTGIGLTYYEDNRNPGDYFTNLGTQCATDAFSQLLKEFYPDIKMWWHNRHARTASAD